MKAYSIIPCAFVLLSACTGGTQQKSEEATGSGNETSVAAVQSDGALDLLKVNELWNEQVLKLDPDDKGTLPNKMAFCDIDGDGCDELIFSEHSDAVGLGYVGVFTNPKVGLDLVDFSALGWQTLNIVIYPKKGVLTSSGSENPEEGWAMSRFTKLVNSQVEGTYISRYEYKEDEIFNSEYKLQKKGEAEKTITEKEFDAASPGEVEPIAWGSLKWEDVKF
ncbi:MAG: hypothetical protein J5554_04410 [Paludibacteraceae bacterium]|nr:hypothetical protein [Paludibacteraceae bacterium]